MIEQVLKFRGAGRDPFGRSQRDEELPWDRGHHETCCRAGVFDERARPRGDRDQSFSLGVGQGLLHQRRHSRQHGEIDAGTSLGFVLLVDHRSRELRRDVGRAIHHPLPALTDLAQHTQLVALDDLSCRGGLSGLLRSRVGELFLRWIGYGRGRQPCRVGSLIRWVPLAIRRLPPSEPLRFVSHRGFDSARRRCEDRIPPRAERTGAPSGVPIHVGVLAGWARVPAGASGGCVVMFFPLCWRFPGSGVP